MTTPRIFISCVTAEFSTLRRKLADVIDSMGYTAVSQGKFPTEPATIREMLKRHLQDCVLLIQLIGDGYGLEPPQPDPTHGRVSYTQFEYLHAREELGIRVLPLFPLDGCTRDKKKPELDLPGEHERNMGMPDADNPSKYQADRHDLQMEYRRKVATSEQLWFPVSNDHHLENCVLRLRSDLDRLVRQEIDADRAFRTTLSQMIGSLGAGMEQVLDDTKAIQKLTQTNHAAVMSSLNSTNETSQETLALVQRLLNQSFTPSTEQLARKLGVAEAAINFTLALLEAELVPPEDRPKRLVEFAQRYRELEKNLAELGIADKAEETLRERAEAALKAGLLTDAERLLLELQELVDAGSARLRAELQRRDIRRAELRATRATAALARFAYREAADLYEEAAGIVAPIDPEVAGDYRFERIEALWMQGKEKGDNDAVREVIVAWQQELASVSRERNPLDWAAMQNNLGNALQTLGEREADTARLEAAVVAYREALQEYTQWRVPLQWAKTQNNLGNALQTLGQRESETGRLADAVAAYRAALEVCTREQNPLDWAMAQNNLGNALLSLGERENGPVRLEQAVSAFRAALEVRTRRRAPLYWAMTQNNLGNSLARLGQRESGTARLKQALVAYRKALWEYTRDRVPLHWAGTQNNLGNVLNFLGEREIGTVRLKQAVAAYRKALKEYTRKRAPLQWATALNSLGNVLSRLGEREGCTRRLEQAIAAYGEALKERTRGRVPLDWAMTQNNLGNAQMRLGDLESGTGGFEKAITAYRAALEEQTCERVPLDWAMTQNNLGNVLSRLGEREGCTRRLEQAIAAYGEALKERTRGRVPLEWALTQSNLGNALCALGEREGGTARLEEAVAAWRAALELYAKLGETSDFFRQEAASLGGKVSYHLLFLQDFESVRQQAEQAFQRDPSQTGIQMIRAHSLLFQGRHDEALAIYQQNWNERLGELSLGEHVLDDFDKLEKAGITHPDVNRIRDFFRTNPSAPAP